MKKGEIYEGTVERIEFPNKGVVVIDGEKAIVKNALPGQKIRFRINKKRGGRCEGMLLEVVEHSKLETSKDVCPHFGICGGCLYRMRNSLRSRRNRCAPFWMRYVRNMSLRAS